MAIAYVNIRKDASQGGSAIGRMRAVAAMATNLGTIASVKDGYVYIGTTNPRAVKSHYLFITETVATANSWPNATADFQYNHNQTSTTTAHA